MGWCLPCWLDGAANSRKPFAPRAALERRNVTLDGIGGTTWCEKSHFGEDALPWISRLSRWGRCMPRCSQTPPPPDALGRGVARATREGADGITSVTAGS